MSRLARGSVSIVGVGAVLAMALGMGVPATAASAPPVAPAPAPTSLVHAVNAMIQVTFDDQLLVGPAAKATFQNGFIVPPGGQDPFPVCVHATGYRVVAVPDTLAVGYFAESGNIHQSVYDYPTAEAGQKAWQRLSSAIARKCRGTWTDESGTSTVERTRLPAEGSAGAGWSVTTRTPYNVLHVAVRPVDGDILMLAYAKQSPTIKAAVPARVDALSTRLATQWAGRATAPADEDALTTWVVPAMLQSDDVPATLPVTSPEDGGWSGFTSSAPGNGPTSCRANGQGGSWSFWSTRGGWGDVTAEPGALSQNVEVYQSDDAARQAWRKLRAATLRCGASPASGVSRANAADRTSSGVSALAYAGVPGVWLREFSTYPESGFSTNHYSVSLLVGNTIQQVSYYESREKLGQIPLDQAAVNQLASTLADRWVAAQGG